MANNKELLIIEGQKRGNIYNTFSGDIIPISLDDCQSLLSDKDDQEIKSKLRQHIPDLDEYSIKNDYYSDLKYKPREDLRFLWLEVTPSCNLKCRHCYGDFHEDREDSLSGDKWIKTLEELRQLGKPKIQFIGGEPLIYPEINNLLNLAGELDFNSISVFSNLTLMEPETLRLIEKYKINVWTSLYSNNPEIHDAITTVPGSFNKTINSLNQLKRIGSRVNIATIILKTNESTVEATSEYIRDLGHEPKQPRVIRPFGRGSDNELIPSQEILNKYLYSSSPKTNITLEQFIRSHFYNSCWSGKLAILNNGDVIPCIYGRNHILGNTQRQSIKEIVNSEETKELWETTVDSLIECRSCESRYNCKDCRVMAETDKGVLHCNPRCSYNPFE